MHTPLGNALFVFMENNLFALIKFVAINKYFNGKKQANIFG